MATIRVRKTKDGVLRYQCEIRFKGVKAGRTFDSREECLDWEKRVMKDVTTLDLFENETQNALDIHNLKKRIEAMEQQLEILLDHLEQQGKL